MQEPNDTPDEKSAFENSPLLKNVLITRTLLISQAIDAKLTEKIVQLILFLEADAPKKDIKVLINSPGGEINSGFAIFDTLRFVSCRVTTVVIGLAASMGSILSLAADNQRRFAFPHAKIMIHQPLIGGIIKGQATDLAIHSEEMLKTKERLAQLYAEKTGQNIKLIKTDMERDKWFTADEALSYKLIDKIITARKQLP